MSELFTVHGGCVERGIEYIPAYGHKDTSWDSIEYPFPAIVAGERNEDGNYDYLSIAGKPPMFPKLYAAMVVVGRKSLFLREVRNADQTALVFLRGPYSAPTTLLPSPQLCPKIGASLAGRCPYCGAPEECGRHSLERRYTFVRFPERDITNWDKKKSGVICTDCFVEEGNEQIIYLTRPAREPIKLRIPVWGADPQDLLLLWDGQNLGLEILPDEKLGNRAS